MGYPEPWFVDTISKTFVFFALSLVILRTFFPLAFGVSLPDSLEVQREAEKVHSSEVPEHSGPIQTRTMAELFVQQGSVGKAIEIFHQLVSLDPDDASLRARLAELEDEVENSTKLSEESVEDSSTIGLYFQNLLELNPKTGTDDS